MRWIECEVGLRRWSNLRVFFVVSFRLLGEI